jgi:hypothetical protein
MKPLTRAVPRGTEGTESHVIAGEAKHMGATIETVALQAGVSETTVSLAFADQ